MKFQFRTPAKINIHFQALQKKTNNYHEVFMDLIPISLYDTIIIHQNQFNEFILTSTLHEIEENNIIIKLIRLIEKNYDLKINLSLHLDKKIPIGGGLGGGSGNVAGTLHFINQFYKLNLSFDTMRLIAKKIGADVPYFINPTPSFAEGEGEILSPIINFPTLYLIIIKPKFSILTQEAYQTLEVQKKKIETHHYNLETLSELQPQCNAFWNIKLPHYKILKNIREHWQKQSGVINTLLSGSGSSMFVICENEKIQNSLFHQNQNEALFKIYKTQTLNQFTYEFD